MDAAIGAEPKKSVNASSFISTDKKARHSFDWSPVGNN